MLEKTLERPLVCWETARISNQSILKKINPEHPLQELMMKLKLQYFGHLMWRANSLEKTLMLGKNEGKRRRGQQRMRWLDSITGSVDMNLSKPQKVMKDREWCAAGFVVPTSWTWLSHWTTTTMWPYILSSKPGHFVRSQAIIWTYNRTVGENCKLGLIHTREERVWMLDSDSDLNPSSVAYWLSDLVQVTWALITSESLPKIIIEGLSSYMRITLDKRLKIMSKRYSY